MSRKKPQISVQINIMHIVNDQHGGERQEELVPQDISDIYVNIKDDKLVGKQQEEFREDERNSQSVSGSLIQNIMKTSKSMEGKMKAYFLGLIRSMSSLLTPVTVARKNTY